MRSFVKGFLGAALILVTAGGSSVLAAVQTTATLGGRSVLVFRPASGGPQPLVMFSHGFGGCVADYTDLLGKLADTGYVIVGVNHIDCATGTSGGPDVPFTSPELWDDTSHQDRRDDMFVVLDLLPASQFAPYISNFTKVAAMGHSLGGYTVMGLAGGWDSWHRPEVRVVLAPSPYHDPCRVQGRVGFLDYDGIVYQGGTLDLGITPQLEAAGGTYDQSPTPKYYEKWGAAGHFAWTNAGSASDHTNMVYYFRKVLDGNFKGVPITGMTVKKTGVRTAREN